MANVLASDIVSTARRFLAEPSTTGRFSDADLIGNADLAQKQVMLRVEWPEATYTTVADGVSREFTLPEIEALLRVYVNGIQCIPSTLAILSGSALGQIDREPPTFQGEWQLAPFAGYPQAGKITSGGAGTMPFFLGQEPSFYLRGGNLGIVQPPVVGSVLGVDVYPVPIPFDPVHPIGNQPPTFFPGLFLEALAWRTLMYSFFSIGDAGTSQLQVCGTMYEDQIVKNLIPWRDGLNRNLPNAPMVVTHRVAGPPRKTGFRG